MLNRLIVLLVTIITIVSCSSDKNYVYYSYNGVTITRIDEDNHIRFYYGRFSENEFPDSYIEASYSGRDGGMGGYLIFKNDKTVEVRRMYDAFEKIGQLKNIILNDTIDHITFGDWSDSIKANYDNVVRVSNVLKLEQKLNMENNSMVEATYAERK